MTKPSLISVDDALSLIDQCALVSDIETVAVSDAAGRRLAEALIAQVTQPPAAVSAMDGYAVRHSDLTRFRQLKVIGEAPAGTPFVSGIGAGDCVRIFTGSVMPAGSDHVVIQEDVTSDGDTISITHIQPAQPRNVRAAGIDFSKGDELLPVGAMLSGADLAVAAASNLANLKTRRPPRVAILANGDELRLPGSVMEPGDIVCSTPYGLADMIRHWGADPVFAGIAPDNIGSIKNMITDLADADIIVPLGGASVGDHDHMKNAFGALGLELIFSKVAVKPGKPTWFGKLGKQRVLGLPGNPASGLVCAHIFLRRLIETMTGAPYPNGRWMHARLSTSMRAEGSRDNFQRATLSISDDGIAVVAPARGQDSSLLRPFLSANVLLHRKAGSPEAATGDVVDCLMLDPVSGR